MAKRSRTNMTRTAKKRRGKKKHVRIDMSDWKSINFHPVTGMNLKGQGYIMNMKTGKVHKTSYND